MGDLLDNVGFYKCLTTAETPALHYVSCWSTTKILPGQRSSAGLAPSFSVDSSSHWSLSSGTPQDHTGTSSRRRGKTEGRRALLHKIMPKCWLEDQNRMRLLPIRWGRRGRKVTQAKWTGLEDPSVFTMKTSQPTPMQHTPLQSPQVITLGLHCFL